MISADILLFLPELKQIAKSEIEYRSCNLRSEIILILVSINTVTATLPLCMLPHSLSPSILEICGGIKQQ